jgi:hypothetical protein
VVAFNFNPLYRDSNRGDQRMLWNTIINLAGESGAPVIASHALTVDAHAVGVRALLAGGRLWNGHADEIAILPGGRDGDIGCVR